MRIIEYLKLIRVYQWYKNLLIFLPLFFLGQIFEWNLFLNVFIGFISLCFISSSNYILNDLTDIKSDRLHPEKRNRPLASGKVNPIEGVLVMLVLIFISLILAHNLGFFFFLTIIFLFVFTTIYTLYLKKEPIADIISISINFVVRAVSGAIILQVFVSPWLILCPFFLALVLAVGKRDADIRLMNKKASKHKDVLKFYTEKLIQTIMLVSLTCLIISYSLYSFTHTSLLLITVPIAIYATFRYYYLVISGSEIARNPHKFYSDSRLLISILLWLVALFLIFYSINYTGIQRFF